MGAKPELVGDLPAFRITITPPDAAPAALTSELHVIVRKPDGTETADDAGLTEVSPNVYDYVATARVDAPGMWRWRVNSDAGIIDSFEVSARIAPSPFTTPLP